MARPDVWAKRAKKAGYRSRAAFKLRQLDDAHELFTNGQTVVDLGAAPGGWMQIAVERVGTSGTVIGVDRRRIEPLEDDSDGRVERIQGDLTEGSTHERIREVAPEGVDVVISDMAPDMSGDYDLDHPRSIHLGKMALDVANAVLKPGGDLVVKVFEGRDLDAFRDELDDTFEYVATSRPEATRSASSEVYLVAKRYLTAPVRVGDELSVTIEAEGEEGDGIAKVEGFTLFIPDTGVGETVEIEVTDVKARFGFGKRRG